jgi:hypothetical protein
MAAWVHKETTMQNIPDATNQGIGIQDHAAIGRAASIPVNW